MSFARGLTKKQMSWKTWHLTSIHLVVLIWLKSYSSFHTGIRASTYFIMQWAMHQIMRSSQDSWFPFRHIFNFSSYLLMDFYVLQPRKQTCTNVTKSSQATTLMPEDSIFIWSSNWGHTCWNWLAAALRKYEFNSMKVQILFLQQFMHTSCMTLWIMSTNHSWNTQIKNVQSILTWWVRRYPYIARFKMSPLFQCQQYNIPVAFWILVLWVSHYWWVLTSWRLLMSTMTWSVLFLKNSLWMSEESKNRASLLCRNE